MRLLTLLLLLLTSTITLAEPAVHFERLGIEEGLSQNSVLRIIQDRQGFLWLGTSDGLNRYDGYQFKHFKHDPNDDNTLSNNYVTALYEDHNDMLWIGTLDGGLNRYDPKTQRFERFYHDDNNPHSLSSDVVTGITQDTQGDMWIGTSNHGLNRYDAKQNRFEHFKHQPDSSNSISGNKVNTLTTDSKGRLLIATKSGLDRYDVVGKRFELLVKSYTESMFEDSAGRLWIGTVNDGLGWFDEDLQQFVTLPETSAQIKRLNSANILAIAQDQQGTLWVGTDVGLYQRQSKTGQFTHHQYQLADKHSISSNIILSLLTDTQGLLWIGVYSGGLNKVDFRRNQFGHFKRNPNNPRSLSHNTVLPILVDSQQTLWIGTDGGGLNKQVKGTKEFEHFKTEPNNPNSLSNNRVWSIIEDSKGYIWLGTQRGGLNRLDPSNNSFKHYRHDPDNKNSISSDRVMAIFEDSKNNLWVSAWGDGLSRLNRQTDDFERFRNDPADPNSLSSDIVTSFFEDASGVLWLGTFTGGLNRFDYQTEQFSHYRHDKSDPKSLSNDAVMTISQDSKGVLWVGTYGGGLNKFNQQTGEFTHYREEHGLPSDAVYSILEDQQGFLWLSTNQGLSKFDSSDETFTNFDRSHGLQSNEFKAGAYFKSPSGELFFGGINGYNRFYPGQIKIDQQPPRMTFSEVFLFNQPVPVAQSKAPFSLTKSVEHLDSLTLNYQQSPITFEFAALDFTAPNKSQYAYQMVGIDHNWIKTDAKNRRATYTNLPSGSYTLRVKASNANGYWNEQGTSIEIKITPGWWETWQAYLLYVICALTTIYGIYRYRTRALVQRAQTLEHRVEQRTATINQLLSQKQQMFDNVSHEFKTPLTLILTPLDAIHPNQDTGEFYRKVGMMKRNGQRLLRMVDQLLELSKLDTNMAKERHYYLLSEALQSVLHSFQPLLHNKNLTLEQTPCPNVVLCLTFDSLEMILNNLISNAIKYTPTGGQISVSLGVSSTDVVIAIQDSGIGISPDNQKIVFNRFTRANETHDKSITGAGIGLALVKDLVKTNQGNITLSSDLGSGSTFTVTLPIDKSSDAKMTTVSGLSTATLIEIDRHEAAPERLESLIEESEPTAEHATSKATLLLIDDNADMLTLLTDTLEATYHCLKASNGENGLAVAKAQLPDLVISDLMMPGINGFEVLKQLKQNPLTSHIPVVLLTAKGDVQSRLRGWAEKADEYLEKPFNAKELLFRIDNLLAIRHLLRQRFGRVFTEPKKIDDVKSNLDSVPIEPSLNVVTQDFIDNINAFLAEHYHREDLDVDQMASALFMGKRQLARKMKSLLDLTPVESIRSYRLKKAAELLQQGIAPSQVVSEVGFAAHSYFSQCFKAHFD
ncbi:MAG: response regulator, partial [Algicola sp.]|nr:response regulator [Algicola sp.]